MKTLLKFAGVLLAVALAAGCSQKDPAAKAIDAAEGALDAVHEDAIKYIPGKYEKVKKELDAARGHFNKEEYAEALAAVRNVPSEAMELAKLADAAKKQYFEQLAKDWKDVTASVPGLMAAAETKVNDVAKLKKLPAGIGKDNIDTAKDMISRAKTAWEEAGKRFTAGDLEMAVAKARESEALSNKAVELITPESAAAEPPAPQGK